MSAQYFAITDNFEFLNDIESSYRGFHQPQTMLGAEEFPITLVKVDDSSLDQQMKSEGSLSVAQCNNISGNFDVRTFSEEIPNYEFKDFATSKATNSLEAATSFCCGEEDFSFEEFLLFDHAICETGTHIENPQIMSQGEAMLSRDNDINLACYIYGSSTQGRFLKSESATSLAESKTGFLSMGSDFDTYNASNEDSFLLESTSSNLNRNKKFTKGSKNKIKKHREFNYEGIEIDQESQIFEDLTNSAKNNEPKNFKAYISGKLLDLKRDQSVCNIQRIRYTRKNLASIEEIYSNVVYEENSKYDVARPYEPQFIRYEIDPSNGLPFNETRCGLCPYCPKLNFKNLKTSTYSQHLALTHGIYTDNYLTPNPLLYGIYLIKKTNKNRKTKAHIHEKNGVVCPCCYNIIGTECSKKTAESKPLNNYMRHFKENHRQSKEKSNTTKFFNNSVSLIDL